VGSTREVRLVKAKLTSGLTAGLDEPRNVRVGAKPGAFFLM
jgi:hypothetical protein